MLPTRAECFRIATVEAMASGLPVIAGDVGGAKDIADDGETGWLIEPTAVGLAGALEDALRQRERLRTMGRRARLVAKIRFDGRANDGAVVDAVVEARDRFSHPSTIRPASGGSMP